MKGSLQIRAGLLVLMCLAWLTGCGSSPEIDRSLVETGDRTDLMNAAASGDRPAVERALSAGARINAIGPDGTALYLATVNEHDEVLWFLLREGARVDRGLADGTTPLMEAAALGHSRMVEMLLRGGADVNSANDAGDTALSYAALNSQLAVTNRLLRAGADVDVIDANGESLLMRVVARNDLLLSGVLVDAGADVEHERPDGLTALDVAQANNNEDLRIMLSNAAGN